jgi:hypothetical protein
VYERTDIVGIFDHLFDGAASLGERSGGANLYALSAIRATAGLTPLLVQVTHKSGLDTS